MATLYPSAIDGYTEIRVVVDRNSIYKIDARDHNDLRSAIVAIEETLGVNPQSNYGTVADRLGEGHANIALHASGSIPRHSDLAIDAYAKGGTPNSLSTGTVNTQVQDILNYLNNFHETTGAGLVGTTGFTTAKNNYTFSGANVQEQLQEIGNFMDYNIDFLQKSFDSFIIDGLNIVVKDTSDLIVDVGEGNIASNGIVLHYFGSEDLNLLSAPGNGIFYIYAYRNLNVVEIDAVISSGLSGVLNNINTICLLSEVTINGSTATVLDLRRFGIFMNDKNGITVGKAPVGGHDGYGCDFISLKAASKFVSLCKETGNLLVPNKIMLVSDIFITTEEEANIVLSENMEIDGAGNTIHYSAPTNLFSVEEDNVTVRNLNVLTNYSSIVDGYFLLGARTNHIENLKVLDCTVSSSGLVDLNSFIVLCGTGNRTVNGLIVRNNNVAVGISGIYHTYPLGTDSIINNAIIDGNTFYQTNYSSTPSWSKAISVGSYCKVINNFVRGGYLTGMEVIEGVYTDVQGNTIIGEDSSSYYMDNGIVFKNSLVVVSDNLISNNIIKGVNDYGINCKAGSGYLKVVGIDSNIVDNSSSISPPADMVSINCYYLTETMVSNNIILYPGANAGVKTINEATQVIGNYICCVPGIFGSATSKLIYVSGPGSVISQNVIKNSTGICIYVDANSHGSVISNNEIYETNSLGANCISVFDCDYLTITNNTIVGSYSEVKIRGGIYLENCKKSSLSGNSINNIEGTAIYTNLNCSGNIISNNIITDVINGINCGSASSEYIIKDNCIIYDAYYTMATENAIFNIGSNSVVDGNYIFNFGQNSSNVAIFCRGIDKIEVINNVIIGLVDNECIGIDCSLSSNNKINGNYFSNVYIGINAGLNNEITNNSVYTSVVGGIITDWAKNHISGNYIYDCSSSSIGLGIKWRGIRSDDEDCLISNNYIYMEDGYELAGISLNGANRTSVVNNFIKVNGSPSAKTRGVECIGCENTSFYSNYIINKSGIDIGEDAYGIFLNSSILNDISSNYFVGVTGDREYSIGLYLLDSTYNKINNNYFYITGVASIKIDAMLPEYGVSNLISGNYILGKSSSSISDIGILINNTNTTIINVVGNFVYMPGSTSGTIGISLGDTGNRSILLSSNIIKVAPGTNETVSFSNYTSMKVIGNIAINGVAPDGTIWDGPYVNSSDDNVFVG